MEGKDKAGESDPEENPESGEKPPKEEPPPPEEPPLEEPPPEEPPPEEPPPEEPPPEEPPPKKPPPEEPPPAAKSASKVASVARSKSRSVTSTAKPTASKSSQPKSLASEMKASMASAAALSKKPTRENIDEAEVDHVSNVSGGMKRHSLSQSAGGGGGGGVISQSVSSPDTVPCAPGLLQKRSPFIHNPPQPEERRPRIQCPRTPREYLINLREDLADFQESHGLPRTRDYSFVSLGLALAQETGRAIYSVFLMFAELFPILAIISLILRFALDKLIEILETTETVPKVKKAIIFALEMLAIMIPLWILIGTIIIPLLSLILSIFKKLLRIKGGKKRASGKSKHKVKTETCAFY